MSHIITFIVFFLFVSCKGRQNLDCLEPNPDSRSDSKTVDVRCEKIRYEADKKAKASGFCYVGPLTKGLDPGAVDPDPEKCSAFYEEGGKKCDALPPLSERPEDIDQLSGSVTGGKPVCP